MDIESLIGKTIAKITYYPTWRTMDKPKAEQKMEEVTIEFTDGNELSIYPAGGEGCAECDPDGSNSQFIEFWWRQ